MDLVAASAHSTGAKSLFVLKNGAALSEQLNLPGIEAGGPQRPRPRTKTGPRRPRRAFNLFFAIRPNAQDAQRLVELGALLLRAHPMPCEPLAAERLHVSLHNLGEYDAVPLGLVQQACRVADTLVVSPFDLVFDQAMVFRGKGAPYVLRGGAGLADLEAFWLALGIALANAMPFLKPKPEFTPHMTLGCKGRPGLVHAIEPVRWPAHELVLINSHQGKTIHEVLGRWAFEDVAA